MIGNLKVMVRIEYEREGKRRNFYGEIAENKLEGFHAGEESFISLLSDGIMVWIDKEAILAVYELETKLIAYEKNKMENESFAIKQGLRIKT